MTITLNPRVKKAKRAEALEIITRLMQKKEQKTYFEHLDGIGNDDIERLYRYFLPAIPKTAKTPAQWIAKATSIPGNDSREFTSYLAVINGKLVATDGNRLHFTTTFDHEEFLDGKFYDPKSLNPVDIDLQFPDIERVIPSYREDGFVSLNLDDCEQSVIKYQGADLQVVKVLDNTCNLKYLLDASGGNETFRIQQPGDKNSPYIIESSFGFAIVAPLNS